jgi:hypothetical protein
MVYKITLDGAFNLVSGIQPNFRSFYFVGGHLVHASVIVLVSKHTLAEQQYSSRPVRARPDRHGDRRPADVLPVLLYPSENLTQLFNGKDFHRIMRVDDHRNAVY